MGAMVGILVEFQRAALLANFFLYLLFIF